MKKNFVALLCAAMMTASVFTGCSSQTTTETTQAQTTVAATEVQTTAAATEAQTTEAAEAETTAAQAAAVELEDGTYTAEFNTDSSMFHANEACDGKGTLTVKDGEMTFHVSLVSENIVNMFVGTAEDAQKDGAVLLQPTTDTVTYSDGTSEEVYGFDIPITAVGQDFDLAILGTKGKWYDHVVSVTNPEPEQ